MNRDSLPRLHPSPNCDPRPESITVDTIVLHASVLDTLKEVAELFSSTASRVSSHYTIDRDGTIACHVPEYLRAWHAGQSRMQDGREHVNDFSIGIELVNRNDGIDAFPDVQIQTLKRLIREIASRHPIRNVVTHAEIAVPPGRKSDPAGFDLGWIAGAISSRPL